MTPRRVGTGEKRINNNHNNQAVYPKLLPTARVFGDVSKGWTLAGSSAWLLATLGAPRGGEGSGGCVAQWRHEQQTVAMALAAATHHSAQRGEWRDSNETPRGQKTATAYNARAQWGCDRRLSLRCGRRSGFSSTPWSTRSTSAPLCRYSKLLCR